ncbi:hypothetical protein ARMGADRAFT_1171030 [Armillaria gallica]|uniref:Actin-like ATPase domain-containing protein n=1 Tax=Armillaria gallica TaxID=47427 RepID=A0A2H3D3S5_ARMGA|nr:hypothetical protein ARMGADRAFT_1171030 [Armillaria gallica]
MPRHPYGGRHQKLVIALDLGTTFSGVSYSILDPGIVPNIKGITRFPAQETAGGDAKIPTIMYYDKSGKVRAAGAEALDESLVTTAEDEGWIKCSRFKLHMLPKWADTKEINEAIAPLPPGKDVVEVFGDFYAYLLKCTMTFIQESHQNGTDLLLSVKGDIEFILSHPNGWEGAQQQQLRRAAIHAGLISDDDKGHERIHFVTEGEASLHFCIEHGLFPYIKDGEGVMIVDAGGGTIDISTYSVIPSSTTDHHPFEEIAAPTCTFSGSIFVTRHAQSFLKNKLEGSPYAQEVDLIAECFDKTTKHRFRNANEPAYIKFGMMKDTDIKLDIRSGQLRLSGSDVASFFEPSVSSIITEINDQRSKAKKLVSSVFLVGGFAANNYLFSKMRRHIEPAGLSFSRPDSHVNKAVADGSISFYLDHFVTSRVAKYGYGLAVRIQFDPTNVEHQRRRSKTFISKSDGELKLPGAYGTILSKGVQVSEDKEFRKSFHIKEKHVSDLNTVKQDIFCYYGSKSDPTWKDTEPDMYSKRFTVTADTRQATKSLVLHQGRNGKTYFSLNFDIIILFGRTEIKAQVCWIENGVEKRGPARILYDKDM